MEDSRATGQAADATVPIVQSPAPVPASSAGTRWRRLLSVPTPIIFGASVAIAIILLWWQGTLNDLTSTARDVDPGRLIVIFLLYLAGLALLCLRWYVLIRVADGAADVPRAAEAFLTSVVVNYAAPIGLAIPTRALLSSRDLGLTVASSGAVAIWEVALDTLVLVAIGAAWLVVGERIAIDPVLANPALTIAAMLVVVAGLLLVGMIVWRRPRLRQRLQVAGKATLRYPVRHPGLACGALILSLLYWGAQGVTLALLLDAVGSERTPTLGLILGLLGFPVLIGMFSPVPGGAGVREALMVAVAQASGFDGAAVLLAAIAYRVALFVAIPPLYLAARVWRAVRTGDRS